MTDTMDTNDDWEVIDNAIPSDRNTQRRGLYVKFQISYTETRHTHCVHGAVQRNHSSDGTKLFSRPIKPQPASLFLSRLPVEIRLQIYETLMYLPEGTTIRQRRNSDPPSVLTVLQSCRQIHFEAEETFYNVNRLQITHTHPFIVALQPFVASLGSVRKEAITKLLLPVAKAETMFSTPQSLHLLPNLRSVWFQRLQSVRFIQPSSWAIFVRQIVAEIEKCGKLEEVRIITPPLTEPNEDEVKRGRRLREVDEKIENAAPRRSL